MIIHVDHWPKSVFVCCSRMGTDAAFKRYTVGMEKPHYPVPSTIIATHAGNIVEISPACVGYWTVYASGYKFNYLASKY